MNVLQILVRMAEHAQILQEATLVLVILVGKESTAIKVPNVSCDCFSTLCSFVAAMVLISLLSPQNLMRLPRFLEM